MATCFPRPDECARQASLSRVPATGQAAMARGAAGCAASLRAQPAPLCLRSRGAAAARRELRESERLDQVNWPGEHSAVSARGRAGSGATPAAQPAPDSPSGLARACDSFTDPRGQRFAPSPRGARPASARLRGAGGPVARRPTQRSPSQRSTTPVLGANPSRAPSGDVGRDRGGAPAQLAPPVGIKAAGGGLPPSDGAPPAPAAPARRESFKRPPLKAGHAMSRGAMEAHDILEAQRLMLDDGPKLAPPRLPAPPSAGARRGGGV